MTTLIEIHITDAENKIIHYVSKCIKCAFSKDDNVVIHIKDVDIAKKEVTFCFEVIKSQSALMSADATKSFEFFDELAQEKQTAINTILEIDTKEVPF